MSRAALTCSILGQTLVGTHHRAPGSATPSPLGVASAGPSRLALLILNAGPAPRSGNSDLSVLLADLAAEHGIDAFRFDAPGVGDSPGPIELDMQGYWSAVLEGRNDQTTLALIDELRRRYGFGSFVVGGLCAGAVTALRIAEQNPASIAGLLLLEPNFRTARATAPNEPDAGHVPVQLQAARAKLRRVFSKRDWLYALTGQGRIGHLARPLRPVFLRSLSREVGSAFPRDANLPLFFCWRRTLERGVPALVVTAQHHAAGIYLSRFLPTLSPNLRALITHAEVGPTNHILTSGNALEQTSSAVGLWLDGIAYTPTTRRAVA